MTDCVLEWIRTVDGTFLRQLPLQSSLQSSSVSFQTPMPISDRSFKKARTKRKKKRKSKKVRNANGVHQEKSTTNEVAASVSYSVVQKEHVPVTATAPIADASSFGKSSLFTVTGGHGFVCTSFFSTIIVQFAG